MAFLYIIFSILLGAGIVLGLKPYWQTRIECFLGLEKKVTPFFIFLPTSYLTGTLVLSWLTYIFATVCRDLKDPLLYANVFSFIISVLIIIIFAFKNRTELSKMLYELKKYGISFRLKNIEWFIIISSTLFWSFFIVRSLYMEDGFLHTGVSAFSDFGAHLPVIRSFSVGQNFPAQYPHFPDGTIRYHFMFYFLAGNLEYLGMSLPQALNIPSILSLLCFNMLLYTLGTCLTKKTGAGLLTCLLFSFRSSFAFFTYLHQFSGISDFINAVARNLNPDRSVREHIGNTLHEDWGLWAQKVYINQRHLSFAFGLFMIILFLMLPLFIDTIRDIKMIKSDFRNKNAKKLVHSNQNQSIITIFIKEILLTRNSWDIKSLTPCILAGLILGLMAFWNGAVVIAAISTLFVMAALSKHKLEYLVTAIITFALSVLQSRIFAGSGTGVVSIQYNPGFLAESKKINHILSYYTELLGILPFVLTGIFIFYAGRRKKWTGLLIAAVSIIALIFYMPSIDLFWSVFVILLFLAFFTYLIYGRNIDVKSISPWLIPVFLSPVILATTLQLTPDITVNHKYIILSVILLNIPLADLLTGLFKYKKATLAIGICIVFLLTCTGIIDMVTLYNLDNNSVSYNQKDRVQVWVQNNTNPKDIFLTHYMTHYGTPMSILLAGRSVYNGYPYFTITAGYDISEREENMKSIYSADSSNELKGLALSEGIDYIVIEEQNRTAIDYSINEDIFYETFLVVFEDKERNIVIFKVNEKSGNIDLEG